MKKLGFGLMRLPLIDAEDFSKIDIDAVKEMVDLFISQGFTYFDTAYPYHGGKSEEALREAVVKRYPRESFTVTDKMPCWEVSAPEDLERIFNEQLQRCGLEYFDYYWLHALNRTYAKTMDETDGWGFIARKKAEGKIKHIGFSFHDDSQLLEELLVKHPETEYVQLQINYLDWESPSIEAKTCYDLCTKYGKPVIVMEPVKGGALANVPKEAEKLFKDYAPDASPASWAVRYAASLPNVMMVLSGMSNLAQVKDNTNYMKEFVSLRKEEVEIVEKAREIIKKGIAIPCTACHYCTEGCPMNICIPEYFNVYNNLKQFGKKIQNINTAVYYKVLGETHGKASDCIECGQCESHCPQHIQIIENLKLVAETFEKKK